MSKPILCLDFDGVLHSYSSGWKGADVIPDPPVPGMVKFLCDAVGVFDVSIFSSRSNQAGGVDAMRAWLTKWVGQELPADETMYLIGAIQFPTEKPAAFVGIDDRVITFTGEWPDIEKLRNFRPWNK